MQDVYATTTAIAVAATVWAVAQIPIPVVAIQPSFLPDPPCATPVLPAHFPAPAVPFPGIPLTTTVADAVTIATETTQIIPPPVQAYLLFSTPQAQLLPPGV